MALTRLPRDCAAWLTTSPVYFPIFNRSALLFLGGQYFTSQNNEKQEQLADDKAKQDTLVKYLDQMADSLQHGLLKAKPGDDQFIVVQSRTVLALQSLDRKRQHLVIQFLSASGLNDQPDNKWQPFDKQGNLNPLPAKSRVLLYQAQLSKANLVNSDLSGAVLVDVDLEAANLGCKPQESQDTAQCSDLSGTDLRGTALRNANLNGANFNGANLNGANLPEASLERAHLFSAKLISADLNGAQLNNADLNGAKLMSAELSGAQLESANLGDANLNGAYLNNAQLNNADLGSANLEGTNLAGAYLNNAQLTSADLTNANLQSAHLSGADLYSANLSRTILLHTDLRQVKRLTLQQLEGKEPPFLCNAALPKGFAVNPNRDCDRLLQVWVERYPKAFRTRKDIEELVNAWRQQKWSDEPPGE